MTVTHHPQHMLIIALIEGHPAATDIDAAPQLLDASGFVPVDTARLVWIYPRDNSMVLIDKCNRALVPFHLRDVDPELQREARAASAAWWVRNTALTLSE